MNILSIINTYLEKKKLTKKALSHRLGYDYNHVVGVLKGRIPISKAFCLKFIELLDDELMLIVVKFFSDYNSVSKFKETSKYFVKKLEEK